MPLDNEKLKKVYATLKKGGYNHDYDSFVKGFSGNENYDNRKRVYDWLTENGAQVGKNYADFMQKLYTPSPKIQQTQTQIQQPRVNRGSMVRAVTDPLNARGIGGMMQNINKVQGVVKKAEKEKANGYQPRFDGVTKRDTEAKIPTLADMKPMPTFEPTPHFETEKSVGADGKIVSKAKPKQIFDGSGQPKYVYQDSFTGKTYDPNDNDPHTQEMIKRGEETASYVQDAPMQKVTDNDLAGLASSIDKRMHEIALQRNAEAGTSDWSGLDMPRGGGALVGNWYTSTQNGLLADEEYKTLGIAQGALARAHKMVEEAEKSKREGNFSGFIKGAGRGFVDGVFDPETWDFGVSSLAEAGYIKNALYKFDRGQKLTKAEQTLLDAKAMEMAVNAFYGSDIGRGYKAGKVTAEAIPFMIEMAINPASGAGKGAASMLTRYALKRFGKKGLVKASKKAAEKAFVRAEERALAKGLSKSAAKAAGERAAARATTQTLKFQAAKTGARVLGDIAGASTMAATTGAMRTAADAVSRHSGDVKFDVDDKGNIVFAGHDKGDDWGTAIKKAFANTAIENYSELFGAYLAPIGSFVGKAGEKLLSKIGLGKVTEMLGKLKASDISQAVKRLEGKVQFNGVIFGEYPEENFGGLMNALIVGDQTLDDAEGTGLFNIDNQIDTILGVGLMGGIFSAARLGGGLVGGQGNLEARRAVRQAGVAALKNFKGKELIWDKIKSDVDNASNDQLKQVVKNIVTDGGLSDENKKAALQYVRSSMHLRGFEAIRPLTKEEAEADAHNVQEEAVHNRGFEADAQERKDIAIESADPNNAEAQQSWAAVEQRINDDATQMAEALREKSKQMQHTDGSFHTATLKEKDEHGEGKQVFIVSGHVQMTPDGTMIDREASDKTIVIFDPSTGERKMIDPSSDFGLSSVDKPTTSEELEASIERERQGFIQAQLDDARGTIRLSVGQQFVLPDGNEAVVVALDESGEDITAMLADGTQVNIQRAELQQAHDEQALAEYRQRKGIEEPTAEDEEPEQSEQGVQVVQVEGAPSSYEPDMELVVRNESGGESTAIVMGRVRYEGGEFVPDENGGIVEYFMDGEVRHEQIGKLNDRVVSHTDAAQVIEEETPPAEDVQTEEETPLQEEESVPAEDDTTLLDEEEPAPADEEDAKEDNAMPMRDNGEEDWEATTPERAHTYIYNEAGLSQREGNEFVAAQKDAAQRALNKAKSVQAPRVGTSIRQYNEAKAKHQEKIENAQRVLDYWNAVQDIQVEIQHKEREQKEAEDAKAHEEAAAQMQADFEERKAESLQEDGNAAKGVRDDREVGKEIRGENSGIQDGAEQTNVLKEDEDPQGNVASSKEETPTDFTPSPRKEGEDLLDYAARVDEESKADHKRKREENKVNTSPSDAQKEAGNYKKGHIKVDGLDITIEQPKGSIRTGKDASGKEWRSEMHNTYGYIRGTESVDGDHIDIFLSDNPADGNVFVVDQVKKDGSFDEHKVMYGFADVESAKQAYLSNYEKGWQGLGNITEVSKDEFKKWIDSSKRKTKPFAEYTSVKTQDDMQTKKPTEQMQDVNKAINAYKNAQEKFDELFSPLRKEDESEPFDSREWQELNRTKSELQNTLLQLNSEEQRELLKQTTHKETKREIEKALYATLKEEQRSIEYNKVLDRQDLIRPIYKEEKKPISVTEFVETDKEEAERRPVLTGVYHDDGYVVGTNAHILLARKEDYDKSLEGKTTNKKGEVIDAKYPNWRAVVDGSTPRNSWGINLDELHAFTRGVLAKLKADGAKKSTIDSATIAFKDTDGKIIVCYAKTLDKALRGAKSIGATDFGNTPKTFAQAQTEKGYVICPTISTDLDIDNNCFVYAPKEAARQQTTTPLTNDTLAKQKATEAVLTALNKAGIEVVQATEEQAQAMLGNSKAEQLKTPQGTVYGWTVNGKIYLTEAGFNPETPIHEYTHLWADAMMKHNKKEWQSVKELLRDTPAWDEVLKDKNYQDIIDDEDAIASEALSRISGKKNAAKMEAEAQKMIDESKDYVDKAKAISLLERMKNALEKFWNWVGKDLLGIKDFSSIDEVTDRVLHDLVNGADLEVVESDKTEKQQVSTGSEEERAIIERAKIDGTYMKAPNGKPTNLNEKQWVQVRTKAFKNWFGDWEKAARIEKLRKSKPMKITGKEIEPSDDLKQYKKNALEYGKTLRGEYTNEDTGETIALTGGNSRGGIREILQHDYKDIEHLQSIAAIPQIIEKSTYIDEAPNEDVEKYPGVKSFRYYVCGLKIGNNDYTVKAVIAVQNNGDRYYDHKLSSIEKGKLLSTIPTIQKAGIENNLPPSVGKDKRLLSILQTNSSKVVDENGEPMVVYHGTLTKDLHQFSKDFIGSRYSYDEKGFFFISNKQIAKDYSYSEFDSTRKGEVIETFLSIKHPLLVDQKWCKKNGLGNNVFKDNDVIEFWDNYQALILEESENNDGVIITDGNTTMDVAFDPNQIKSAVNNNGEFSLESDDIRFRKEDGENQEVLRDKDLSTGPLRDREAMRNEAVQLAEKLHTPVNIVEDANKITHQNKEIEARRRKAKGWYNVSTGEVVVVLANHKDAADVAATISHEVIAHKGLRELVGEAHYDEFLDEVYNHLRGDLKREIDDAAGRAFLDNVNKSGDDVRDYKRHKRIAVDELFGSLAEKPFEEFSESERNLWQKIKEFAKKLLDRFLEKLKLPKWFELGDNELRYILWRSKERLERGKEDPIDQAMDIVKREELGLANESLNKVSVTARNFDELAERNEWNPKPIRGEEMVDLYDIAPKVTTHDYYLGTKADFKLVKSAEDVWDAWEKLKQQDGFRHVHSPKSDSEYLVNDKTGEIYRISDHWGWVASCRWEINGRVHSGFNIGKANIKDFERIKGSYVFTPEAQRREPLHKTSLRAKENLERALKDDTYKFTAAARRIAEEKVRTLQSNAEFYKQNHESGDIVYRRDEFGKYIPYREMKHIREQWFEGYISDEEREIVERAQADESYMKAPNGKPSNLNGKQWAQVRTKAFKKWFGDWEKAARIEKLRKSEPVVISGNEYKGKYELNRDSAKAWIKENLRGEYTVADTGERIFIGRKGVNKVTSHSMGNESHLKCLVAIPQMLEQSVFITEEKAEKPNAQYPTYRYYVAGLKIGGVDYTAKLTIGVDENGNKYYDHALTEIEKGKLLDQINDQAVDNGFMSTGAEPNPSVTIGKDTKLVSILQVNSSKVVDENGEPQVIHSADDKHIDYFLNIRHPLEASEDVVVSEIADKAVKEGYDGVHTSKGYFPFTVNQYKSAQRNNGEFSMESDDVLYRDSSETRDIWLDQSMGLHERTTAAAARLANNHRDNKVFMQDAMRAIGANLTDLRKAMRLQKDFDRTTAKRVYDLARILMEMGYLRGLNQQEVSKLLSVMKNSIGKQNIDNDVQKLMDLMVNHQLKQSKNTLESLERIKGSKVNAKGVEVQGVLDAEGQAIMAAMKAAKDIVTPCAGKTEEDNGELTAWGQALEDVQERIGSEDNAIAENAALEYQGMMLAQQWFDEIKQSELEEATLRKELNHAPSTTPAEDRKGEAYKEYIGNLKQAIQQNKIDRAQAYMNLVGQLTESLRESIEGAKAFKLREKARISAIQRDANLDMEGRPAGEHYVPDWKARAVNNCFVSATTAPLATMDQMLRVFGNKSANGEGYLYNRFERGFVDARQQEIKGYREKTAILDAKAAEIFGGNVKTWADLIRYVSGLPSKDVVFKNDSVDEHFTLSQGNLMYIYMVNKMLDGRLKLAKMGLTDDVVEELAKEIDPRLIKLADWMQEDFLVQTRNEYNETHKRVFGASMAAIEDYFPLKIRSNARIDKAEDLDNPTKNSGISTTTGSIIKRRRNSLPLDLLNADALNIILGHITEMEHWNAFVEYNRDLNTLRTYKRFRNGVENMTTIYGSGKKLWKHFNDLCQITTGSYIPPRAALDEAAVNLAKGVTAAKVSFRLFTALKQFLSFPAYFPEVRAVHIAKCLAHPKESWDWCMENLPIFNERWNSRLSGDPRLLKTNMDWKMWRTRAAEIAMRIGMTPNAFVDALTVSIGARAMYMTRKGQYLRDGYTEEEADKRAKQDAEILYNQTQQSSEGAFLSRMQVDRGWLPVLFSIFRNSSMAYTRQLYDATRNLRRNITPGGRKESIAFMTKQYMNEGFDKAKAEENAKRKFDRQIRKDILRVATFGYILQFAWNLGAYLPYLLFGNDDDEKEVFWQDVFAHSYFGSLEGLTGGDVISQVLGSALAGNLNPNAMDKDMPLTSDLAVAFKKFTKGDTDAALSDMINLIVQSGIGVNPQSITDSVLAIMDACGDDPALANEATIFIARILQVPQSQIDKLYFDEVGLMGSGLSKYTPAQLAERYARYKVKRGHFSTPWAWDDDVNVGKAITQANREIKERTNHMGLTNLNEAFAPYEEVYQKVDKQMEAYEAAKKTDYVKAANMMVEIQKDKSALDTYQKLKSMDRQLDKMAKRFLSAKSDGERQLYRKMIESYKPAMLKVLQAKGEAAQEKAMDDIGTLMEGFAEEQEKLYENQ